MNILGISGSLRKGSYNSAALRAAQELAPEGVTIQIADISDLPLYNDDVRVHGYPAPAERFRAQIKHADALLFATPEYNYSISGVLKNAIDWASRPPEPPLAGKPAAMMSASMGIFGGVKAQFHLRQIAVFVDLKFVNKPEVAIATAQEKFDAQGNLTFEPTRELIRKLILSLVEWTTQLQK
jgi:chromate reductase